MGPCAPLSEERMSSSVLCALLLLVATKMNTTSVILHLPSQLFLGFGFLYIGSEPLAIPTKLATLYKPFDPRPSTYLDKAAL